LSGSKKALILIFPFSAYTEDARGCYQRNNNGRLLHSRTLFPCGPHMFLSLPTWPHQLWPIVTAAHDNVQTLIPEPSVLVFLFSLSYPWVNSIVKSKNTKHFSCVTKLQAFLTYERHNWFYTENGLLLWFCYSKPKTFDNKCIMKTDKLRCMEKYKDTNKNTEWYWVC